uniref:CMP-N-acetylneuraminate-beta-galactosamide-alpha-2,3-sialyltransferase 2 n=1 Tax=Anthurium amnicola TaxID=1678845 RepID=A0A1D1XPS8_9ARAE
MRAGGPKSPSARRPTVLLLLFGVLAFSVLFFSIQSSFFTREGGIRIPSTPPASSLSTHPSLSRSVVGNRRSIENGEVLALLDFQSRVQQCVASRGLGLIARIVDHCKLILKFPDGTNSTWYNEQFKIYEPLEYTYDVCDALLLWEQYRNMTTVLTREYLDARPDGWLKYAAKRIAQLGTDKCYNRSLCEEHLNLILPTKAPFHPHQFRTCAVVGNSGDLLKTEFGQEIDMHDAVIRDNEAPVNKKYAKYVGLKRDFRLVVRGAARNMVAILNGSSDEVLIIKSLTHRDFNSMIKELSNPVYLFQGIVLRRGAKGTGMKSIELALSMCDIVDIYGFTVDPGYTEWTRYFSTPRKGHNPLQGRAYYQLLECLGVIRIHSPMRAKRKQDWSDVPNRDVINSAHAAAFRLKRGHLDPGPFSSCKVWGEMGPEGGGLISGSPDMSKTRRDSNYSKWEVMPFENLRGEARDHFIQMNGVSLYKMDGNKLDDLVCVKHKPPV